MSKLFKITIFKRSRFEKKRRIRFLGPEENPTLLHFAARFGLEKLAWQLLECPGGDLACDLKNVSELTPADLAEQAGHARLAHQLRGYMVQKIIFRPTSQIIEHNRYYRDVLFFSQSIHFINFQK